MAMRKIHKLGTLDCDIVETTPIVFKNQLYRFEYIRKRYYGNNTGNSYFRFRDLHGNATLPFGTSYHLGSAFVDKETIYVFGIDEWGGHNIRIFSSRNMVNWKVSANISLSAFSIYNNSVCQNANGEYVMLIELGLPTKEIGIPFTPRFLKSNDLLNWEVLPEKCIFGKDFYTGGHFLIFEDEYYYLTYVEELPGPYYVTHIVRSRDLTNWENSNRNPFMVPSEDDKTIHSKDLTEEQVKIIASAKNINSSDHEFCEFNGNTYIFYSWGDQQGNEFLAEARYEGTVKSLLESFFPKITQT